MHIAIFVMNIYFFNMQLLLREREGGEREKEREGRRGGTRAATTSVNSRSLGMYSRAATIRRAAFIEEIG